MIYGSVCSGIEAATHAWHSLGWKPSFFSEIDNFPREVLKHHYPQVPLHGDFTTIKKDDYEPIELLVGGTPCQSFSVAGLRAGLNDPRGNLMLEFGSLANRLQPRWLVWENVPGVLSSNSGKDFTAFLDMLELLGYIVDCDILDAQFHGVPQRRRRVFVCAQHRDDLLNQMTDSSALTIAQCLQEILQAILVETQKASLKEPIKSELAYLSKDGVMRRMELFGMLGETNNLKLLQRNLVEAFLRYQKEQNQSDAHIGGKEKELIQIDRLTDLRMGSQFTLTEQSLNSVLEESFEVMRLFTTLTETNTITPMQIYTCSQAVLHIEKLIQHLSKSCPPYWNAELSSLTSLEEYTNYARQTSSDIFGDMDRFQAWCDFIRQAECTNNFIGHSNKNGSAAAVLFERHSLQGNIAPSRETRQEVTEIAGTLTSNGGGLTRPAGNANELDFCVATGTCSGKETFGTLMANCGTKQWLGNQEALSGDYHVFALAGNTIGRQPDNGGNGNGYDESGVSYTLTKTDVHAVAHAFKVRGGCDGGGKGYLGQDEQAFTLSTGADQQLFISNKIDTLYNKGITQGERNDKKNESNTREILRLLLTEIGEKAFTEWGFGILNSLQQTEILQQALHGIGLRCPTIHEFGLVDYALSRKEDCSARVVYKMRKFASDRCSSFGWGSHEQRTIELGAYLSELSQPRASAEEVMRDLWEASEGAGLLHQALSKIQEIRGCTNDKNKPILETFQVRRLTPTECEFLQGFSRNYTNIPDASDSARYKALGNSMAVPVMKWIGNRIDLINNLTKGTK